VHRSRLWAQHLPEFGWEPIVVTTHWKYYEEGLDVALSKLVNPELRIIRTKALPTRPVRIVGDIGVRALPWHFRALGQLIVQNQIDFVHITVPSNYSALLGEMLYRRYRFPFGIDYIDPWVHIWPGVERTFSKAWMSFKLGNFLEPWAVKNAALITGVASSYYEPVLERNPHLRARCVTAAMPYGNSDADFESLPTRRDTFLFQKEDGLFHLIYAGAMLPKAYPVLERFFEALAIIRDQDPRIMERLRVHFVGTGKSPNDPEGYNILPYARRSGLELWVDETPRRIGYVDVLTHLSEASAILVIGSTEPHYSPSKVYQAVRARRPIFALLHEQSTAVDVLRNSQAGRIMTLTETRLPSAKELASALASFIRDPKYSAAEVKWNVLDKYSARNSARLLAGALNTALELFERREASIRT
jgi:glycosyltransferase involved in cell wall biosynthesis